MPSVRDRVKEVLNLSQQTTLSEDLTGTNLFMLTVLD